MADALPDGRDGVLIDGHVHCWSMARQDDILVVRLQPRLQRDYLPSGLEPLLRAHGVGRAVLIQSAPSLAHVRWLLEVARPLPAIARVIGWADLEAPDVEAVLADLRRDPKFIGIRAMVNRAPDPNWLRHPAVRSGFDAVARAGLVAELLMRPAHLGACLELCRALPDLPVVVDHGANPDIRSDAFEPWGADIAEIGRSTSAVCKVAGLAEAAGPSWTVEQLKPFFGHLLEVFGHDRLLFGSNWPVIDLVGDYRAWWDALHRLMEAFGLDGRARKAILGGTAARVYAIPQP
jgi:L-fuconolactonase